MTSRSFREIDEADVYKAGLLAGTLTRANDTVEFRYRRDYLAQSSVPDVAWSLPKSTEPTVATGDSVPPFFAGLLPEGA